MRILIAEDDPMSRLVLENALIEWGHAPVVACDGDEAWQVIESNDAPLLAILDWMMPGMDGIDICRMAREVFPQRTIYIIMLTTKGRVEEIVEGLQAGANDYVISLSIARN